jgi:hypothetical protein
MSASEYRRLAGERPSFAEAVRALRSRLDLETLGIGRDEFEGLRDRSAGREVGL